MFLYVPQGSCFVQNKLDRKMLFCHVLRKIRKKHMTNLNMRKKTYLGEMLQKIEKSFPGDEGWPKKTSDLIKLKVVWENAFIKSNHLDKV